MKSQIKRWRNVLAEMFDAMAIGRAYENGQITAEQARRAISLVGRDIDMQPARVEGPAERDDQLVGAR